MIAVSDSSPLIGLEQIEHISLLQSLFVDILIPPSVAHEIRNTVRPRPWIHVDEPGAASPPTLSTALGPGESDAIRLAIARKARVFILDDEPARRAALSFGLPVIGTAGILLLAKERGLIKNVKTPLDALIVHRF